MTEISDFSQLNSGDRQPVDLATMEAAAGWQAAFGVTDFALITRSAAQIIATKKRIVITVDL